MIKADVALGLMAWSQNWPIRLIIQTLPLPPWTPHPQPLSSRILKMNQELWPFQLLFQTSINKTKQDQQHSFLDLLNLLGSRKKTPFLLDIAQGAPAPSYVILA